MILSPQDDASREKLNMPTFLSLNKFRKSLFIFMTDPRNEADRFSGIYPDDQNYIVVGILQLVMGYFLDLLWLQWYFFILFIRKISTGYSDKFLSFSKNCLL